MGYTPGEENIKSAGEDDELMAAVYSDLMVLERGRGFPKLYGSTRFGSHGYVAGFTYAPDISVLQVKYPEIEFKIIPEPIEPEFHVDDQFGDDITVAYRIKGSRGWHLG